MTLLNSPTLVLNRNWFPISIEPLKDALIKAFTGSAHFMDEETCSIHTWESWFNQFSISLDDDPKDFGYEFLKACAAQIRVPEVIVLSKYNKIPKIKIRLTRKNILIRDRFCCQYCNKRLTSQSMTLDHVMPRSRGGKTTWENIVCSCFRCNVKKNNKTPDEARIKLTRIPKAPHWSPFFSFVTNNIPKSWEKFVNTDQWNEIGYWNVELID